ncbi:MAG TPA: hypothetical protein VHB25_03870 [Gemmatimonadaceae bacterium]|nr:hypothetical protein [Gemmatimonadaceae bacterium]
MADRIANIGGPGVRRRRASGYLWLALSAAAIVLLFAFHAPRAWRAVLVIPFALSAIGFFQARDKT